MRIHLLLLLLVLTGCATIKSGSHSDDSFATVLQDYRTFAWIADDPLVRGEGEGMSVSPLTKRKISSAIANTLEDKGFRETIDRETADFIVAYTVGTREKIDEQSYPVVYVGEWGWHLYGRYYVVNQTSHKTYTEGTLGVDIFDGHSKQPVWHGWASKTITPADRSDPSDSIKRGVQALLSGFPSAKLPNPALTD